MLLKDMYILILISKYIIFQFLLSKPPCVFDMLHDVICCLLDILHVLMI